MPGICQNTSQIILALLYPLRPRRLAGLPGLWAAVIRYWLKPPDPEAPFPPIEKAMKNPDGLLAVGGPLTTQRLIDAYRKGIIPFCHLPPMKWWAPGHRMVLAPEELHVEKNVRRLLRRRIYRVTFDQAFRDVILACKEPRENKYPLTWITDEIIEVYSQLFAEGYAHSVEIWDDKDQLVGGIFGVSVGRVFFNKSQFARVRDTSKLAMAYLNCHLYSWGYRVHDCLHFTPHLEKQGARLVPRDEFSLLLDKWCEQQGHPAPWKVDEALDVAKWSTDILNNNDLLKLVKV